MRDFRPLHGSLYPDHAVPLYDAVAEDLIPDDDDDTRQAIVAAGHPIYTLVAPPTGYSRTRTAVEVIYINPKFAKMQWYQHVQILGLRAMRIELGIRPDPGTWVSSPHKTTYRHPHSPNYSEGPTPDGLYRAPSVAGITDMYDLEWSSGRLSEVKIRERIRSYARPHQIWGTSSEDHAQRLQTCLDDVLGTGGPHQVLCVPWWGTVA